MVKTKTIIKVDRHSKAIQLNNSSVEEGAVNSEGEARTVNDMTPTHSYLGMILLAFK